jgi:hypothetical protein
MEVLALPLAACQVCEDLSEASQMSIELQHPVQCLLPEEGAVTAGSTTEDYSTTSLPEKGATDILV